MKKPAFFLALTLLAAPAAFAQYQQFGIAIGGSKRLSTDKDAVSGGGVDNNFQFGNSVKEAWYEVEFEPDARFRIKVGQLTGPGAFQIRDANNAKLRVDVDKVNIDHIDADIDYRFSEPFGSTGIFAGIGFYRQTATVPSVQVAPGVFTTPQSGSETNYGFQLGVNGDFPLSARTGVVVEAAYHAINYHARPRYVTLTGGLRFSF